jgi:hypothetical protein
MTPKIGIESIGMIRNTAASAPIETEVARETAAERMRRCRARRRAGYRCFMVEIHRSEIDRLVQHGLLRAAERDNEGAVVDVLSHYIEQTLGSAL